MISKNERLLAALIFVLWSLGVVVLPALGQNGQGLVPMWSSLWLWLLIAYFCLHIITLCYAVYALAGRLRHPVRRKAGWHGFVPILLYVYAVVMLCVSSYLLYPALSALI